MKRPVILDGALGSLLIKEGAPANLALVNTDMPDLIRGVHKRYTDAGSEQINANTFCVNPINAGDDTELWVRAGLENARAAVPDGVRVALNMCPLGKLLEPYGDLDPDEAYKYFLRVVRAGLSADLAAIETMASLDEALIALRAAKSEGMTAFVTMSFGTNGRTLMGDTPEQAAKALAAAGADAVGMNCSVGPDTAAEIAARFLDSTDIPVIIKPNNGLPDKNGAYSMTPAEFADKMARVAELGVSYVGGCCGTTPEHIAALAKVLGC